MRSISLLIWAAGIVVVGCGGTNSGTAGNEAGGAVGAGGSTPSGGAAQGGTTINNGTSDVGGEANTGGSVGVGGSVIGGTTSAGGSVSVGGTNAAGGANVTGGAGNTGGGTTSKVGTTAAGGSTGGATTAGGATGTGGSKAAGGTTSKGGATATGGSSTSKTGAGGNSSTGGAATGGATTAGGATGTGGSDTVTKKFIGNISAKNKDIPTDFADKWQQVTMEANSKWGFVQPDSADKWVWDPVDKVHQYAKDHGIVFKEHNFFWNFEQPSWVTSSNIMTVGPKWVEAFCKRYPDVPMIDVVNEPLTGHNPAPYASGMGGAGTTGYDWVKQAFVWARQYCPNAILILNDYNIIEYDDDHNKFVDMLQKLLQAGAPIDAIGAQGHDVYKIGYAKSKTYLDDFVTKFNLPIYITELDIDQTDDAKQATMMQDIITGFYAHPAIKGITHWGEFKGSMWRANAWLEDPATGTVRPAMTWLQTFIKAHPYP
jgi:endo-1,4-beta-xylanase